MEEKKSIGKEIRSWILTVLVPVAAVLLINLFVCKIAVVSGSSMYPTLQDRDLLLVWMLGGEPEQGEIVVIDTAEDSVMHGDKLVKRVIAKAGQTVRIDYETNTVYVDGEALREDYLNFEEADPMLAFFGEMEWTIPEGCLFVLGDNRNYSSDSRDPQIGLIALEDIVGVEILRIPTGKWFAKG